MGTYLEYWGFSVPPFQNAVDLRFFYESPYHSEALLRLTYTVTAHKGAAVLMGDIGCGKTLICRAYMERLPRDRYEVYFIPQLPLSTEADTLRETIHYFGEEASPSASAAEMLRFLNNKFLNTAKNGKHTIIVIDEAQLMKTPSLEMVRLLLNYQYNNNFLCTVILVGQPELKENIHRMKPLEQRISVNYHLKPLDSKSSDEYIKFRTAKAGCKKPIFKDEVFKRILHHTGGVPRKINNICDLSLLLGFSAKKDLIDEDIINRVGEELSTG